MKFIKNFSFFIFLVIISILTVKPVFAITSGPVSEYSFSAMPGLKQGSVKLTWYDDGSAKKYNLMYGTDQTNYSYGVVDIPYIAQQANEFTVGYLEEGQIYYFKLLGMRDGASSEAGPVMARASSGSILAGQSTDFLTSKVYERPYLFTIKSGSQPGTVDVTWFDNDSANKYDLVYGANPLEYAYGWQDMPYSENLSNTFTVRSLAPGKIYYFALVAERNNNIVYWSKSLSISVR